MRKSVPLSITTAGKLKSYLGLNSNEVEALRKKSGPNDVAERSSFHSIKELIKLFSNPLILILIVACLISMSVGQTVEGILILAMVSIGMLINFIQTYRSAKALEDLRAKATPKAMVWRDGHKQEIARRDLVPGDIIELVAGDLVPADSMLLEVENLHIHEAALTGESIPSEKRLEDTVYLGSSVVSGCGVAQVQTIGSNTRFGNIIERLREPPPESDFDRGTRHFGILILKTVFILVIFVFSVNAIMHRGLLDSLLFAIALAVGLTPEFLPVITTVTLARGAIRLSKSKVIVKHLSAMQNFGSIDVLCSDKTGTITSGEMKLSQSLDPLGSPSQTVLELAHLNSYFQSGIRSPLDQAILNEPSLKEIGRDVSKISEIPFDFERRRLSVVVSKAGQKLLISKGAPESILKVCSSIRLGQEILPFGTSEREACQEIFRHLHDQGLRVLAIASRHFKPEDLTLTEENLILNGYLAFADPILPGVKEAIDQLNVMGVEVKILTGDNELVAQHVCQQAGLQVGEILLGDQIEALDDVALSQAVEKTKIFARVSPAQKHRILLSLKSRGHIVGFMGDGINDAPSLHAADIGISFSNAVDVAKDASDIILVERNLSVLHDGIIQGRQAFGNVMKYILMGTSSNFGNMFSMAAASLMLPFLPLLPAQILLNNFLYDLAQISIPTDHVDDTFTIKPRHWDISLIRKFMLYIGPLSSIFDFITFAVLLTLCWSSVEFFRTGWFVESLFTQTLVIFSIRTAGPALKSRPSPALVATVFVTLAIGAIIPFTPIGKALGFTPLTAFFGAIMVVIVMTYLVLVEILKRRLMRYLILP